MNAIVSTVIGTNAQYEAEVIFVDDGSGDNSYQELLTLQEQYPNLVKVIKLTRNFGQLSAIMAGLSIYTGDCAIIMSADNQDPAEIINQMLDEYVINKFSVVIGTRESRDESWYRIWTSRFFYWLMQRLSFKNIPIGGFDFMLLGRRVVDTIQRNQEATPFLQGQVLWTGYDVKFIEYHRREREIGESRWTFGKKVTYLLDGVMSYSFLPIRFISFIGFIVALSGFLYAFVIIFTKLLWDLPVEGWAPIMVSVLVIGGMQMLMLGLIGEYLWRVLAQVRNRDLFVVDVIHDKVEVNN